MAEARSKKVRWRPWVRAMHRDIGYFIIGLTIIYALSGLAVNHIAHWDPSFHQIERTHVVSGPFPDDEQEAAKQVLARLEITEKPTEVYRVDDTQVDILFDTRTYHLDTATEKVIEEGQEPRFFFRLANWLHLNRGKKAWTVFADGYAIFLLFLALSGLFMIPGRKGFIGRGAIITALGAAIPIAYIVWSGGP